MIATENTVEKRKYNRFKAQEDPYVAIVNDSTIVGQIINISKGGLALNYIGKEAQITGWHKVNIFLSGNRFYLKEVPFKAISDFYIGTQPPFSSVLMKQCCGQFGELTREQKSQLDYFLANHTTGELHSVLVPA